ncbi:MAG TPA: ATP-binding protein [Pyrinomonadaceae bacterium]|nr:ATP-binding protein [Pyrinomonadaceae bacterium]
MRSFSPVKSSSFGFVIAICAVGVTTLPLKLLGPHINPTTVALAFLLIILFIARAWGPAPAVCASVVGILSLNFFFLPPFGTFAIRDPANWIAFVAFMVTAITVGQLSGNAKQRAEDAENAKREVERLYYELQDSFDRSSQAKALKQSERLKSSLLDAVTHDFRTPLTSIKASATAMLDDIYGTERDYAAPALDQDARKEMLQVIDEEADRLDRFVEGLTKLARIDAGDMHLQLQPASVEEMVTAALKRAEPRTRSHRLEVWIEDLPPVTVDEHAMSEAIYTLVDNAAKYSPHESPITVRASHKNEQAILISVEDHGPGIRAEVRDRVFEKFFRAMRDGDISDRRVGGTGMGLAIARGIIEAHHGHIWVEDAEGGQGARFVIELPINPVPASARAN